MQSLALGYLQLCTLQLSSSATDCVGGLGAGGQSDLLSQAKARDGVGRHQYGPETRTEGQRRQAKKMGRRAGNEFVAG